MKIAVVGGGIAGLSTAYYLQKAIKADIDIYEKAADPAGLAGTFPIENTYIERYYHHIFTHDRYYLDLVKDLGLEDQLIWKKTKMGFYYGGITYPLTTPVDILRFKPLSFINRIRFGVSSLIISKYSNINKLESTTTEDFLVKIVGKQVWDIIWKPLLKIKFGDNYNKIPAVWIWERIVQRFKSRSGAGKDEVLGYMKGSFGTLNQKLLETVQKSGAKVFLGSNVSEIIIEANRCKGLVVNTVRKDYDLVVFTAALPAFTEVCKNAPPEYIHPLKKVKYDCTLGVLMSLTKSLSDVYWLNVSDNEIPFGGVIEHTNLIAKDEYNGRNLVYFSKYLSVDNELLKKPDSKIIKLYVKHLKKIYPEFDESTIHEYFVFKDRYAQPIWPMNYSTIKPSYKTPINGLFLANTSQIYPNDRGMNFSVKLGKEVSSVVIDSLKSS